MCVAGAGGGALIGWATPAAILAVPPGRVCLWPCVNHVWPAKPDQGSSKIANKCRPRKHLSGERCTRVLLEAALTLRFLIRVDDITDALI